MNRHHEAGHRDHGCEQYGKTRVDAAVGFVGAVVQCAYVLSDIFDFAVRILAQFLDLSL